jgi:hypothetical protein
VSHKVPHSPQYSTQCPTQSTVPDQAQTTVTGTVSTQFAGFKSVHSVRICSHRERSLYGPYAVDGTRPIYRSIMDTYGFIVDAMGPSRTLWIYHGQYGYIVDAMDPWWTPGVHHGHYESIMDAMGSPWTL